MEDRDGRTLVVRRTVSEHSISRWDELLYSARMTACGLATLSTSLPLPVSDVHLVNEAKGKSELCSARVDNERL